MNQAFLDRIRIVLVNTTHPGNIGAVARAIKNMGLSQLVIVDPKDYPSEEATWRAANAVDVLEAAKVYPSLDEALAGCGLIVGTSARERKIPWPLFTPREIAAKAYQEVANPSFDADIALVFGREDRGLTNDELQKCHLHLNIPTNPDYSSLNLGAAVQVVSYEMRLAALEQARVDVSSADQMRDWDVPPADSAMMERFYEHLEQTLIDIDYLNPKAPRQTMPRFKRLFNRQRLDEMEVQMLRGLLKSIDRLENPKKKPE